MRRIFLASCLARTWEMRLVAQELRPRGHVITSRWIDGEHIADPVVRSLRTRVAQDCWDDLMASDLLLEFTGINEYILGKRHVEFGAALARGIECVVIGPRENVFHYLSCVRQYDDFEAFLAGHPDA